MKTTVQKAYLGSERVLVDNQRRVWVPEEKAWMFSTAELHVLPDRYETWSDVPFSWVGGCPWFR